LQIGIETRQPALIHMKKVIRSKVLASDTHVQVGLCLLEVGLQGRAAQDLQLVVHSLLEVVQRLVLLSHQTLLHLREGPLQQT
jgi:hypothetical protein